MSSDEEKRTRVINDLERFSKTQPCDLFKAFVQIVFKSKNHCITFDRMHFQRSENCDLNICPLNLKHSMESCSLFVFFIYFYFLLKCVRNLGCFSSEQDNILGLAQIPNYRRGLVLHLGPIQVGFQSRIEGDSALEIVEGFVGMEIDKIPQQGSIDAHNYFKCTRRSRCTAPKQKDGGGKRKKGGNCICRHKCTQKVQSIARANSRATHSDKPQKFASQSCL